MLYKTGKTIGNEILFYFTILISCICISIVFPIFFVHKIPWSLNAQKSLWGTLKVRDISLWPLHDSRYMNEHEPLMVVTGAHVRMLLLKSASTWLILHTNCSNALFIWIKHNRSSKIRKHEKCRKKYRLIIESFKY